jgi:hypothetical protein
MFTRPSDDVNQKSRFTPGQPYDLYGWIRVFFPPFCESSPTFQKFVKERPTPPQRITIRCFAIGKRKIVNFSLPYGKTPYEEAFEDSLGFTSFSMRARKNSFQRWKHPPEARRCARPQALGGQCHRER